MITALSLLLCMSEGTRVDSSTTDTQGNSSLDKLSYSPSSTHPRLMEKPAAMPGRIVHNIIVSQCQAVGRSGYQVRFPLSPGKSRRMQRATIIRDVSFPTSRGRAGG
ncbi:hypothetical protein RRG08_006947 [Elysia crispata]|uniref:Uncharacterized protein n=1 Tax=Elysia crispata TaxID=231223 RepID=A0AAE0XRG0_9GAST|nr:hypothetical protein RRG08_006947 [Elysia crispata]